MNKKSLVIIGTASLVLTAIAVCAFIFWCGMSRNFTEDGQPCNIFGTVYLGLKQLF